jgi:hypothetical protein
MACRLASQDVSVRVGTKECWEQMQEPPGQGEARPTANGGAEARLAARWPEAGDGKPRRMLGWGRYPAWAGLLMVPAAAVLGAAVTVASHRDPGRMLAFFVVAGTVAAGTSIRARSAYTIIPAPALAYAAAAVIAGLIHDRAIDTSRTALEINAVQWVADGFIAMTAATILAAVLVIARWLLSVHYARTFR